MLRTFINSRRPNFLWSIKTLCTNTNLINTNESKSEALLRQLSSEYDNSDIVAHIIENSAVKNIRFKDWQSRINILKKYLFEDNNCFQIINRHPEFLRIPEEDLAINIKQWTLCKIKLDSIHTILTNQPVFLTLECAEIRRRMAHFISICKREERLVKFLVNCPEVMFENWNYILLKIDYLYTKKRVSMTEIFNSTALSHSLDVIKLRFDLLEKCGIFEKKITYPHKVNKYVTEGKKNPHLQDIFHPNDDYFIHKIAKITLEEYNFFAELQEQNEIYDETDQMDGDSDSDSDCDN